MIKPTVGRVVHVHDSTIIAHAPHQPLAGIVCYVHNDRLVNLVVFDMHGVPWPRKEVRLLQDHDKPDEDDRRYAFWMDYQKGQAARTEQLEKELARS